MKEAYKNHFCLNKKANETGKEKYQIAAGAAHQTCNTLWKYYGLGLS